MNARITLCNLLETIQSCVSCVDQCDAALADSVSQVRMEHVE